ncbi:hypothetical protein AB1Y20_005323 [Prymnesium parvum]|uniref:Plastid lipid-associated protein/fibrillin conserved domain-containing protein n=1 Tax=Prymnesium parvum TaxID=97485 RepID=A0AB34J3U3_PRYPA
MAPPALASLFASLLAFPLAPLTPCLPLGSTTRPPRPRAPPLLALHASSPVAQLLSLVAPTDVGIECSEATRAEIDALIRSLEESWAGTDAFSPPMAPLLLRNAEVCYVGQRASAASNAAGGKYRGRVGRLLFRTEALFQHVLPHALAVNAVHFRLLGLLEGKAILRGAWRRADADERAALRRGGGPPLSENAIAVDFEPPRLALGRAGRLLLLQLGPASKVALDVTFLDETIRICRGASSGVPFVFRADTCEEGGRLHAAAEEWRQCMRPPTPRAPFAGALLAAAAGSGAGLLRPLVPRWGGLLLVAAAVAALRSTGGIVVEKPESRRLSSPRTN